MHEETPQTPEQAAQAPAIVICPHAQRPIPASSVQALYTAVGWWPQRRATEIAAMLDDTIAVGAWAGEQLVGFVRVVSDEHFRAFLEDVVVHPDFQRRGIGRLLLDRVLAELDTIDVVSLFCAPHLVPFYKAAGFRARRSQVVMLRGRPQDDEEPG